LEIDEKDSVFFFFFLFFFDLRVLLVLEGGRFGSFAFFLLFPL